MKNMQKVLLQKDIVIYGLSTETQRVLKEWDGKYNVIGLLDGYKSEGSQFGYPILDIKDILKKENVVIVVVARPGSCKAIMRRIGASCSENNIAVFDVRGKDLLVESKVVYDFANTECYFKENLIQQIRNVEVVSFDLFDTLIARNILWFEDLVEIIEQKLHNKGVDIRDFVQKRISLEKKLSCGRSPKLEEIYAELLKDLNVEDFNAFELAELEYRTDCELICPRKDMIGLIHQIKKLGKSVYITTDSYYTKQQIEFLLKQNGIDEIDGVIVSCEYDTKKTEKLFEKLIEAAGTSRIIHIGDDIASDIESAMAWGLKSFHIYNTEELLDKVGGLGLISDNMNLSDRIRIGMFKTRLFNSPFQFEDSEKKITVKDVEDLGYLFIAPIILDFVEWFSEQVDKYKLKNIWFSARDGYLIQKVFALMFPDTKSDYFLTSRISAIRAGVDSVSDVKYVDDMKYCGGVEDNLKIRFGIDAEKIDPRNVEEKNIGLMRYAKVILNVSREKRINYQKYIEKLNVKEGGIAFFDFVAKGTCQMYIERMLKNPIKGLYFLQLEPEYMKNKKLDILPFYTEKERDKSAIYDNYYILETVLTSPDASVEEFDQKGNAKYAKETRNDKDINCIEQVQNGILEYVNKYLSILPYNKWEVNKKLDEVFLSLIHNVNINNDFTELLIEDPFFNRTTDVKDIL
jgi:predicted HAD superfamily hydrolase